jgi:hypothetical protein
MSGSDSRILSESSIQTVREELRRVLEGGAFRTSKRCREFLEYIVDHTLNGPAGALKERSIGVQLFRLPQDFDTGQHTVVRVTANEVRKRLAQHYLPENGDRGAVRIELPPGSYSAEFRWEVPATPPPAERLAIEQTLAAEALAAESSPSSSVEAPFQPQPAASVSSSIGPPTAHAPAPVLSPRLTPWVVCAVTGLIVIAGALSWFRLREGKPDSVNAKTPLREALPGALAAGESLRMIAGSTNRYADRNGRTWAPDRYFSGGNVLVRPSQRIFRTLDPDIYRHLRSGDFQYDIPLQAGSYEMHLHFAETGLADFISAESSGEGQRLFRVSVNGESVLTAFDVVADAAGANIADERVFRNISPAADGLLHLSFNSMRSTAMLNAIELIPMAGEKVRPVRIRAGWTGSWQDSAGQQWLADSYFLGGNALVRTTNPVQETNSISPDAAIYSSERWGHFSYALPVAEGKYRVTLKFCEGHYGKQNQGRGGVGSRLFDVFCNGVALLRNFDIYREAGGEGRPIERSFSRIQPNAQGKIVLSFVPVKGMACVNGIEVVEDAK